MITAISVTTPLVDLLTAYRRDKSITTGWHQQMEIAVRAFARHLGRPATVAELQRANVHDYMDAAGRGAAAATVNSKRSALLALWNYAVDEGADIAPPRRVKRAVEGRDPPNAWTLEQVGRLFAAARMEPGFWGDMPAFACWELGLSLVWDTGCRFAELWLARCVDLDPANGTWRVPAAHRKGRRQGRLYRISAETAALAAQTMTGRETADRLWPFPFRREQVWVHFDRILTRAGLPTGRKTKWHCLRRTAESHAAAAMGSQWAAEAVGHSEAVARKHYLAPDIVTAPTLAEALPRPDRASVLRVFAG